MPCLLDLVYLTLIAILAPWLAHAAIRKGKYRDGWAEKFLGRVPRRSGTRPCVWLHAVSVGEVNLLQPILTAWEKDHSNWNCVISTTTRTGYALARKKYAGYCVFYCPLDFSWAVRQAMRRLRPDLLILAELELWPNLIRAARRHGAKVAVVNGRLSEKSFRGYGRIRPIIRRILRGIDLIAVQNESYAQRFRALGAPPASIEVTGSIKFDGARADRDHPAATRLRALWTTQQLSPVLLAGSTQEPEERLAVDAFRSELMAQPGSRLIIVPRHPERFDDVAAMLDGCGIAWQRRSDLEKTAADDAARILLVDVVGELGDWWALATIGFVGGSMGQRGGQNMIEPAAYGVAVSFGPNTWNFRDIVTLLLGRQAAVVVRDGSALNAFVRRCARSPEYARQLGQRARSLVIEQQGATRRTVQSLHHLVAADRAGNSDSSRHAA